MPPRPSVRRPHIGIRPRATSAAVAVSLALMAASGCGGSGGGHAGASTAPAADVAAYVTRLSAVTERLSDSASATSAALLGTSGARDLTRLRTSTRSQMALVSEQYARIPRLAPPQGLAGANQRLRRAVGDHREYLALLMRITGGTAAAGLADLGSAQQKAALVVSEYRAFFRVAPRGVSDGITDAGLGRLGGLRRALTASDTPPPVRTVTTVVTPAPTPSPAPATEDPDSDVVAFSGGVGVRYRYSPQLADLVPGNGPREGQRVSVLCYTSGENVRGNTWWARIDGGYYVPATYLRSGNDGPPVGVTYC